MAQKILGSPLWAVCQASFRHIPGELNTLDTALSVLVILGGWCRALTNSLQALPQRPVGKTGLSAWDRSPVQKSQQSASYVKVLLGEQVFWAISTCSVRAPPLGRIGSAPCLSLGPGKIRLHIPLPSLCLIFSPHLSYQQPRNSVMQMTWMDLQVWHYC